MFIAINFQWIAQVWIVIDFHLNREEITRIYCIKKNSPNNCCKGSCHLNSTLKKLNTSKSEQSTTPIINLKNFDFYQHAEQPKFSNPITEIKRYFSEIHIALNKGYVLEIAHPPTA